VSARERDRQGKRTIEECKEGVEKGGKEEEKERRKEEKQKREGEEKRGESRKEEEEKQKDSGVWEKNGTGAAVPARLCDT